MAAVSKSLTKDDLGCVVEALTPVKHKWEVIGLQIGVRSHVLEAIKLEHSRNPGPCLLAVLKEHLSKIDPQPCWEGFVKALRSESVGETASAEALRLKFCPNEPLSDVQSPECSTSDDVTSPVSTSASEQNQFPFLKLPAEMSEDARETLYGRLSTEHREMQRKFQRLVTTTRKGVAEKGVTPEQLSDEICCQTYESQIEKVSKKLLSDSQEEIRKSKSINDAFFLMRNHYSFFNYELIEEIITIFDLDRSHLSAFEEELRRFCERRVHEFPAKAYGTDMSTDSKLTVVLDSEFDKYTMNSLRSFRHRLGKIFKVSSAVIRLIEVFEGSIEIVFAISSSLVNQILPLSEEQEKSLRDEGVKRFEFTHHPNSFMAKPKGPVPTTPADLGEQLAETTATRDDSGTACIDQEERITSGKLHLKVQLGDAAAKSELLEAELAEWKARCAKIEDDRTRLSEELKQAESKIAHLEEEQQALQGELGAARDTVATTKTEVEQEKHSVQVQLEEVTAKAEQLQAALNVTKSKCYELERKNEEMGKLHLKVQLGDVSAKSELLEAELAEWKARCAKLEDGLTQMSKELKQSEARFKDVLETIDDQFAVRVQSEEDEGKKVLSEKLKELDILRKLSTELAEKLEFVKLEAATYKEDFETERREREGIASAMVEQKAKMELQYQNLKEECDTTLQANVTVSEREDQKREIAALRSQSEDQQQQYDTLRSEADTLKQRVTNLRAQLYKRLEEIEQLHLDIKRLNQDHQDYLDYITAQQKSDMMNAQSDKRDIIREKEQLKLELEHLKKWMQQAGFSVDPATGALPVPRKPHPPATDSVSMLSSRANQVSGPGRQQQYAKSTQQSVPVLPVPRKRPPPAADTLTLSMLPSRANQGSGPQRQQQYPPNYPPPDPYQQGPQIPDQTQLPSQPRQAKSKYVTTQQASLENLLSTGIDTDIHNIVAEFGGEYETSSNPNVPFDPNLVCPMCGLPFRIGQIQKFKTHVRNCKGASSSDSSHPQNAERPLADSHRQSDCHSKHPDSGFMSGMHSHEYSSPHKHPDSGFMSGMHSQNVSAEVDSRTHKSTK